MDTLTKVILIGTYAAIIIAITEINFLFRVLAIGVLILVILYFENIIGKKVHRKIGKPCKINNGVQYYMSRRDLPFEDLVRQSKKEIIFVSVTHEIVAPDKDNIIRQAIENRNIRVRVMILDPTSQLIQHKERVFGIGAFARGNPDLFTSLKQRICDSKDSLQHLQTQLSEEKMNMLTIQTYDFDISVSLMIIDHGNDNACIKIEEHYSTENSRPNKLVFLKDNQSYYNDYYHMYEEIQNLTTII